MSPDNRKNHENTVYVKLYQEPGNNVFHDDELLGKDLLAIRVLSRTCWAQSQDISHQIGQKKQLFYQPKPS